MLPNLDWLCDGFPLMLEWLIVRHRQDLVRLGGWRHLEDLRRDDPSALWADMGPPPEAELEIQVLQALARRRIEPLQHYVASLGSAKSGGVIGPDLARWHGWAKLPIAEALMRVRAELPLEEETAPGVFVDAWASLVQGQARTAATRLGVCARLAAECGLERLAKLADGLLLRMRESGRNQDETAAEEEGLRRRESCYLSCHRYGRMLGRSPAFMELVGELERAAQDHLPLLLVGETGTGKELAVEFLHQRSFPMGAPLVAVNCAGLGDTLAEADLFGSVKGAFTGAVSRDGLVAEADGGLLFLDEFGALPGSVQARLLRFLESGVFRPVGEAKERRVRVRVVAATCEPARIKDPGFRQDLLHRVAGRVITVPPLRKRLEDVPLLVRSFLLEAGVADPSRHRLFSTFLLHRLAQQPWPGNIRQLRHLVLRLVALPKEQVQVELAALECSTQAEGGASVTDGLDTSVHAEEMQTLREAVAVYELGYIRKVLAQNRQDKRSAARQLGISLPTLYARLKQM